MAARSGIEAVLQITGENKNWRSELSSGKTFSYTIDGAAADVILSDENDADLADNTTDPFTLTSVATINDTKTTLRVTVLPIADTYRQRVIEEKPIRYWPLDETSGFTAEDLMDQSNGGYSNPGALAELTGYDGLPAMLMDNRIDFAWTPHRDAYLLDKGTVMCWVYCNGNTAGTQTIIDKTNGSRETGDFELSLFADTLEIIASLVDDDGDKRTLRLGTLTPKTWTHIAVTFNGDKFRGFVNGNHVATDDDCKATWGTDDGDTKGNTHNLNFGVMYKGIIPGQSLNGSVRDVTIFDKDLSGGTISDLIEGSVKAFGIRPDAWTWVVN